MTTFAYEVSGFRRKDGTHLVKIRMTHRRKVGVVIEHSRRPHVFQ